MAGDGVSASESNSNTYRLSHQQKAEGNFGLFCAWVLRLTCYKSLILFYYIGTLHSSNMNKSSFTNSDIRLGFEVECVITKAFAKPRSRWIFSNEPVAPVFTETFRQFQAEVRALPHLVRITEDSSINCGDFDKPVEMKTIPLPPKDAMILLEKVLEIVNKYGHTNTSCGFHVNLSSKNKSKMRKFNPIPFLSSPLWDEILAKFKRKSNTYCKPLLTDANITKFHTVHNLLQRSKTDKYRCVNLTHFGNGCSKSSRIEVRGFGNSDYSKKFDVIASYIKRIERLFKLSCSTFSEMRIPKV